ncbi:MAG TPA: alpha/beta fold hydrolase [Pyrinomonadaceae bacterium]|jgi:pimeloyl-ACP methyl ester carboxylesterase|nr:alpha/beta fold hydrolase [Pyrinomonadaceae bacterium]
MPKVAVNGLQLYYEIEGNGEPVVLIPGFAAGRWIWFKQTGDLSRNFRVIVFDPRGVSASDKPEGPQTISLLADDVAHLLQTIGIASAHIVGASFGGFVAQEFALRYPSMTRKLVLCCTSFGGPHHVVPAPETLMALASTKGLNSEERMRANLLLAFTPEYVQTQVNEVDHIVQLRATNDVPEHIYLSQLQAAVSFNAESRHSDIKTPTLVLSGDADVIVPVQNSRNLAAAIPGAKLQIVEGGSHTFFIEQAHDFNQIISAFIRG